MQFQIVTLFPERFESYVESGLPARALGKGVFNLALRQLRDFAEPNRRGRVDDIPYGGGPGMILEAEPIARALESFEQRFPVVVFTPRGQPLRQKLVRRFAALPGLTMVSGYFEGIDERLIEERADFQISLGDYILGSGDLPSLVLMEAVTRLLPGYVGSETSLVEESHEAEGVLEYPQYTRPAVWNGHEVPVVLRSGNHQAIARWRQEQGEARVRELIQARQLEDDRKES